MRASRTDGMIYAAAHQRPRMQTAMVVLDVALPLFTCIESLLVNDSIVINSLFIRSVSEFTVYVSSVNR